MSLLIRCLRSNLSFGLGGILFRSILFFCTLPFIGSWEKPPAIKVSWCVPRPACLSSNVRSTQAFLGGVSVSVTLIVKWSHWPTLGCYQKTLSQSILSNNEILEMQFTLSAFEISLFWKVPRYSPCIWKFIFQFGQWSKLGLQIYLCK